MEPLGVLIDANNLKAGVGTTKYRRGIFFVCYNLINELVKRNDIRLYFYINKENSSVLKKYIKKEWPFYKCIFFEYRPLIFYNLYQKYENSKFLFFILSKIINYQKNNQRDYCKKFLLDNNCKVYLSTYHKIPGIFSNYDIRKFTIVYDLIPFLVKGSFSASDVEKLQRLVNSFNQNDYYFTISECTKRDLISTVGNINSNHVYNSYISCRDDISHEVLTDSVKRKYNIPLNKKYIFSLFAFEKRKNLENTIKAFLSFVSKNKLKDIVYVVGGSPADYKPDFSDINDFSNIIFTGYIDDSDLNAIYSGAEFFVFTSMYEGFGLPVLEAMRCGCPVVTSNSSSLPEVIGDAGIMIDWDSLEQHVAAFERYYFDSDFKNESIKKGFMQSKKFSWKKTVDLMIEKMRINI